MDLTKAKSEGYLWGNGSAATNTDSKKKFLAVIGVYTGFGSRLKRNTFRGSWMPRGLWLLLLFFVGNHELRRAHGQKPANYRRSAYIGSQWQEYWCC
jgi:hypothetical protein